MSGSVRRKWKVTRDFLWRTEVEEDRGIAYSSCWITNIRQLCPSLSHISMILWSGKYFWRPFYRYIPHAQPTSAAPCGRHYPNVSSTLQNYLCTVGRGDFEFFFNSFNGTYHSLSITLTKRFGLIWGHVGGVLTPRLFFRACLKIASCLDSLGEQIWLYVCNWLTLKLLGTLSEKARLYILKWPPSSPTPYLEI